MFVFWCLIFLSACVLAYQLSLHAALEVLVDQREASKAKALDTCLIVVFKDESSLLPGLLDDLVQLKANEISCFLVDDHSTDEGPELVRSFATDHEHLMYQRLPDDVHGKKAGLHHVLSRVNAEYILLTDADCSIPNAGFVERMRSALAAGADLVVGSGLMHVPATWIGQSYAHITLQQHVLFHAAIAWKLPYMAVGRSMAFRLDAYKASGAMSGHLSHSSGTDDLLLQDFVRAGMRIVSRPDALTYSYAPISLSAWVKQRSRHLSVGDRYPIQVLLMIWTTAMLPILFTLASVLFFFYQPFTLLGILSLFILLLLTKLTDIILMQFLDAARVQLYRQYLPWLDVVVSSVNALISAMAASRMPKQWTRRT